MTFYTGEQLSYWKGELLGFAQAWAIGSSEGRKKQDNGRETNVEGRIWTHT